MQWAKPNKKNSMRPIPKLTTLIIFIVSISSALLIYVYFQFHDYLIGPTISISYPIAGSTVYGPEVEIKGLAKRISFFSLNDSAIFTDPTGSFKEKLILPNGYNIMKFEAKDRFGHQTEKLLEFTVTSTPPK